MIRLFIILIFMATSAAAVEPDEILSDPALELRARDISANLRCVVCQNEPIDTSNSGVARDLRLLVRERLVAGDTDEQVYDYMVSRYGDYVLFNPPWKSTTYALWLAPFVIALLGGFCVIMVFRRSNVGPEGVATLTADEEDIFADVTKRNTDGTTL